MVHLAFQVPAGLISAQKSKYRRFRFNHWSNPHRSGWNLRHPCWAVCGVYAKDHSAALAKQGCTSFWEQRCDSELTTSVDLVCPPSLASLDWPKELQHCTRRTWSRTSGRDKLPSGCLFQHPHLLIHKPFYDVCIHCIRFSQAQACFPLHSTCHWPVTTARFVHPMGSQDSKS